MDRTRVLDAASKLEDLTVIMKEMITNFHNGTETNPYAAVYWLRRELGHVVATLGGGQPSGINEIAAKYQAQVQR